MGSWLRRQRVCRVGECREFGIVMLMLESDEECGYRGSLQAPPSLIPNFRDDLDNGGHLMCRFGCNKKIINVSVDVLIHGSHVWSFACTDVLDSGLCLPNRPRAATMATEQRPRSPSLVPQGR